MPLNEIINNINTNMEVIIYLDRIINQDYIKLQPVRINKAHYLFSRLIIHEWNSVKPNITKALYYYSLAQKGYFNCLLDIAYIFMGLNEVKENKNML